ncbi:hypothetical protein [Streptomyces goshikiensis]|uniref:hypothetical protein n=1 Tax=Streptomyces goshikiensis TaxID=1942 RepID=UPI003319EE29
MDAADPGVADLVVDNPGTAIADCCLEPGHRTANVSVAYEGSRTGGNVFGAASGYRPGRELDPSGAAFGRFVRDVPDAAAMRGTLRTASERGRPRLRHQRGHAPMEVPRPDRVRGGPRPDRRSRRPRSLGRAILRRRGGGL